VENLSFSELHVVKREIRVVGIDDGNFLLQNRSKICLVGVIFRGGEWLDGVLRTKIDVNGFDATKKIVRMIKTSNHYGQIRILIFNKIYFGKSNIVNVQQVFEKTKKPTIVFMKKPLNLGKLKLNIRNSPYMNEKLKLLENLEKQRCLRFNKKIWLFLYGIEESEAKKVLEITLKDSLPEPLRVARLIASALNRLKS
jgi:hypothetical protein